MFQPRRTPHRRRLAFTLIELLIVMGIIVILVGLLFAALKYARNSAAQSRTRAQLDTLRGMLAELDAANHLSQGPSGGWVWYDDPTLGTRAHMVYGVPYGTFPADSWTTSSGTFTADFWKYPFSLVGAGVVSPPPPPSWDALDSPGDVGSDGYPQQTIQRNASLAVVNTQLAMQMLASIPANRSAIEKLPENSKMTPVWNAGAPLQATVYSPTAPTFTGLLKEDGTDGPVQVQNISTSVYTLGVHVSYQGRYYVCTAAATTFQTPPTPQTNTANWTDETSYPRGVPILLDGWSNPIIYVPATGLHVKLLNGQGSYLPADPSTATATGGSQEYIIISPEGSVSGNGGTNPVVTRPGRPFFASAGPDGDFTKGDDNIYSFNN